MCLDAESDVVFQKVSMRDKPGSIRFLPKCISNNIYNVNTLKPGEYIDIFFDTESPMPNFAFCSDYSSSKTLPLLFLKLFNTWQKRGIGYYNKCIALFFEILSEMEKENAKLAPKKHAEKLSPAIEYITTDYCNSEFDYKKLALLCGVSYTYFNKLFLNIYNVSPSEYVKKLRIQKACELILTNRFSISEVSELCGYKNLFYFSRVFKNEIGVPPSDYKKMASSADIL